MGERPTAGSDEGETPGTRIFHFSGSSLEVDRGLVIERRMKTHTIVKTFDEFDQTPLRFLSGVIVLPVNEFHFQRSIKALHGRVVPAVALAAHARAQSMLGQQALIMVATVGLPHKKWTVERL